MKKVHFILAFGLILNNAFAVEASKQVLEFMDSELEKIGVFNQEYLNLSIWQELSELEILLKEKDRDLFSKDDRRKKTKKLIENIKSDEKLKEFYFADEQIRELFKESHLNIIAIREACARYVDNRLELIRALMVASALKYQISKGSFNQENVKKTLRRLKFLIGGSLFLVSAINNQYHCYPIPESMLVGVIMTYATIKILMPSFDKIYDQLLALYINKVAH